MKRGCAILFQIATIVLAALLVPLSGDELKTRALRLGYFLNGESMVRALPLGSIDVSGLLFVPEVSLLEPPAAIPPTEHTPAPAPAPPPPPPPE
jgi:hypothetical protein